jgi:RNA polymerase sigma-70 factor (ECF subfamily)
MVVSDQPSQVGARAETEVPDGLQAEEGLLSRARAGDAEAFCRLAEAHEARLYRQAVALCREESLAEDLAAETLVEAWKSLARYAGGCRFSTWLYAILLHRHHKHLRRSKRVPIPLSDLRDPASTLDTLEPPHRSIEPPSPADQAVQADQATLLQRAIGRLPEKHRHVILLRFFEEASLEEIATALQCSVGTVKSRLHHGLEKLRRRGEIVNLFQERRDG